MKITITLSGLIGFAFVLICLSIVFQRIYGQNQKENQLVEKFNYDMMPPNPLQPNYDYMNNNPMNYMNNNPINDMNNNPMNNLESSEKVLDSECAFDYIRKSMADVRQKEAEVDFLEKKFKKRASDRGGVVPII